MSASTRTKWDGKEFVGQNAPRGLDVMRHWQEALADYIQSDDSGYLTSWQNLAQGNGSA